MQRLVVEEDSRCRSFLWIPTWMNMDGWTLFLMTFQLMRVKHRHLFASFHWGLFCQQDWICRAIKSKEHAVPSILDLTGIVQHTDSWLNMYGRIRLPFDNIGRTFSPTYTDGWVKLIITCKTIIHWQQWAFISKSSVRHAHKNRLFFRKAHNLGTK